MEILKGEWIDWKNNKVTQEFFDRIQIKREFVKEGIAEGAFKEEELATIIGRTQGYKDVLEMISKDFEVVDPEEEENKQNDS